MLKNALNEAGYCNKKIKLFNKFLRGYMSMEIRSYNQKDEKEWVRCRVLSFLDTAYFDHVLREKETYDNPSIELVAVIDDRIVGLIDIEYELEAGTLCSRETGIGGMI